MLGKLLKERYQIIYPLSAGAFGQTYVAVDTYQPNLPKCVVKHLKSTYTASVYFHTVKQRFLKETEILGKLHSSENIPKLLAYFEEEQEFYIVQEFIEGDLLSTELPLSKRNGQRAAEEQCVGMLQEILSILDYIHSQGVIHGDIKPNNLIRRTSDGSLFLLDFGVAQPIYKPLFKPDLESKPFFSSGIPNQELLRASYIAPEQFAGYFHPSSDIYAVGMLAIMALGGRSPEHLKIDPVTHELLWQDEFQVTDELATVINRMVLYNYNDRYQSAFEVLSALHNLFINNSELKISSPYSKRTNNLAGKSYYPATKISVVGNSPEDCLPMESEQPTFDVKAEALVKSEVISLDYSSLPEPERVSLFNGFVGVGAGIAVNVTLIGIGVYALQHALVPESEEGILAKAQKEYQAGDLDKAIALAKSISARSNIYPEAQAAIVEWRKDWETAEAKFNASKQAFFQARWSDVFQEARKMPNIYFWRLQIEPVVAQAKTLMEAQAHHLLQGAYSEAENKDFTAALKYLKQIPPETEIGQKVQEKLSEYSRKQNIRANYFLQKAYDYAEKKNFKDALKFLKQIPQETPAYAKAQVKIAEYTQKLHLQRR